MLETALVSVAASIVTAYVVIKLINWVRQQTAFIPAELKVTFSDWIKKNGDDPCDFNAFALSMDQISRWLEDPNNVNIGRVRTFYTADPNKEHEGYKVTVHMQWDKLAVMFERSPEHQKPPERRPR